METNCPTLLHTLVTENQTRVLKSMIHDIQNYGYERKSDCYKGQY